MEYYRIKWKSLSTGHEDGGSYCFDQRSQAQDWVSEMNRKYSGEIIHWIHARNFKTCKVLKHRRGTFTKKCGRASEKAVIKAHELDRI